MSNHLSHRIIVLTGPTGSGKTTIKRHLQELLERAGMRIHCLSSKDDLYLPFAKKQGFVPYYWIPTKQTMQRLMKLL